MSQEFQLTIVWCYTSFQSFPIEEKKDFLNTKLLIAESSSENQNYLITQYLIIHNTF